jgi:putative phosphoesterase
LKKIGLISDTHGFLDERVFHHFASCDEVWHAGDIGSTDVIDQLESFKPLRAVWGNIDGTEVRKRTLENLRFVCEGLDVWITHIGGRPGNYALPVKKELTNNPPGLFVCGHSHIVLVKMDAQLNCLHMNPGAAGKHGFHKTKTLLRFSINSGKVLDLELIELGPRA